MPTNKTIPTDVPVADFLEAVTHKTRKADALVLIEMLTRLTGKPPVMWGPSIIGFGQHDYTLKDGSTETMLDVGFAPRSTGQVFYLKLSLPEIQALLPELGKHKTSVACLYVTQLAHVDMAILEDILRLSYLATREASG